MATASFIIEESFDEEYINEGLRIFKASKRLNKLADKIENKLSKKKEDATVAPSEIKEVKEIIKKTRKAAQDFEKLEEKFKNADREERKEIREEEKKLKEKYEDFLKKIRSDEFKKLATALGIAGLVAGIATGQFWISLIANAPKTAGSLISTFGA